jgi:hypothetical protein
LHEPADATPQPSWKWPAAQEKLHGFAAARPSWSAYVPAVHALHAPPAAVALALNFPFGHLAHVRSAVALGALLWYSPATHAVRAAHTGCAVSWAGTVTPGDVLQQVLRPGAR